MHWIPFLYLELDFGSDAAIVATSGVEEEVVGTNVHVLKKCCSAACNSVPTAEYDKNEPSADD